MILNCVKINYLYIYISFIFISILKRSNMKKNYVSLIVLLFAIHILQAQDPASKATANLQATTQAVVTFNKIRTKLYTQSPM